MINDILGDVVPNMDVEPIEPGCGCGCMTKSATDSTYNSARTAG